MGAVPFPTPRNCYHILGVERSATADDIRNAYIRLSRRHHPDVVGRLPARLHDVQLAYRCLSNSTERARHDQAIAASEREHHARRRALRRRLHRFDGRHPAVARAPRTPGRRPWRLAIVLAGALLLPGLALLHLA